MRPIQKLLLALLTLLLFPFAVLKELLRISN